MAVLGLVQRVIRSETIIGFDGKEHDYLPHAHRDGLHDHILHQDLHNRRHISHPRLRRWDVSHLPHMLNQAPIIISQHNLRIVSNSRHLKSLGFGVGKSPAASAVNATKESSTALNRIDRKAMDLSDVHVANEGQHNEKRSQHFYFRAGHKQTERNAAEDLTAEEMQRQTVGETVKASASQQSSASMAGPAPAPATAPASAPSPVAAPAAAPVAAKEPNTDIFSMSEDLGAQEQGFSGDVVQHDNGKTMTKDWRGEYGPGSGMSSYVKICQLYPDNQWCHDRGYHRSTSTPPPKSAAVQIFGDRFLVMFQAFVLSTVFSEALF